MISFPKVPVLVNCVIISIVLINFDCEQCPSRASFFGHDTCQNMQLPARDY